MRQEKGCLSIGRFTLTVVDDYLILANAPLRMGRIDNQIIFLVV